MPTTTPHADILIRATKKPAATRLHSVDYLRGAMAASVMLFHYLFWTAGSVETHPMLSKLGLYAVSIFYILSGLSLGTVYWNRIANSADVRRFAIKRCFRIVPLFSVVTLLPLAFSSGPLPWREAILNVTLLFGFLAPDKYLAVGAWSIGNEAVFYTILPFVILGCQHNRKALAGLLALSLAAMTVISFAILPQWSLEMKWSLYVNPLNQIFLFLGGVAMSRAPLLPWKPSLIGLAAIGVAGVFAAFPVPADRMELVMGSSRLLLTALALAFVYLVFSLRGQAPRPLHVIGSALGNSCYSIYLLHPLVWGFIAHFSLRRGISLEMTCAAALAATLIVSLLSFAWFEQPMIRFGSRLANRCQSPES